MAYIAAVPPIRFINIGSSVGTGTTDRNNPDDVLILRAFMIYLQNQRNDLRFTKTRLTTLSGSLDANLHQMIIDYKALKTRVALAALASEERGNDRVVPQDLRFAAQSASSYAPAVNTIIFLNLDVRPLAGYGDTVIDVMCNLFPIGGVLSTTPVRPQSYWRDLARNKIPWNKWLRQQQEDAMNERQGATLRLMDPTRQRPLSDEDNELFSLLAPYQNELKSFWQNHTRIEISTSPSPSAHAQPVTVKISVSSYGGQMPVGFVRMWFVSQEIIRFYGRQSAMMPSRAQQLPLQNGSATLTVPEAFTGSYRVITEYPDTGAFEGSNAEITHEVR